MLYLISILYYYFIIILNILQWHIGVYLFLLFSLVFGNLVLVHMYALMYSYIYRIYYFILFNYFILLNFKHLNLVLLWLTLYNGTGLLHPPILYYFLIKIFTFYKKNIFYLKYKILYLGLISLYLGSLWSSQIDLWGYFWINDFIEYILMYSILLILYLFHKLNSYKYILFLLTQIYIVLIVLYLLRNSFFLTQHNFFNIAKFNKNLSHLILIFFLYFFNKYCLNLKIYKFKNFLNYKKLLQLILKIRILYIIHLIFILVFIIWSNSFFIQIPIFIYTNIYNLNQNIFYTKLFIIQFKAFILENSIYINFKNYINKINLYNIYILADNTLYVISNKYIFIVVIIVSILIYRC